MEPISFDSIEYEPIVYDLNEIIDDMDNEEKESGKGLLRRWCSCIRIH